MVWKGGVLSIKDPSCSRQRDQVEGFARPPRGAGKERKKERPLGDPAIGIVVDENREWMQEWGFFFSFLFFFLYSGFLNHHY